MENITYLDTSSQSFVTQKINESIVPPSLQFLFGSGGNIIAIVILFVTSKRHKWKPFQRLVFSLALTDLCGHLLVYPFAIKRYASDFTYEFTYALCQHIAFMISFALLASAMIVMVMSLDRFLAILFPFVYNVPRKILRTYFLIITSWLSSGIICILPITGVGKVKLFYPGSWCFIDYASKVNNGEIMTYIYAIIGIVVFILTLSLNVLVIFAITRKIYVHRKRLGSQKRLKSDIYVISFLLVIVIVFSVCWMPLMVNMIKSINNPHSKDDKTELFVIRLAVANSIINPWIYILLRKENFTFVEQLFNKWRRHAEEQSQPSGTTTQHLHDTNFEPSTDYSFS